jgi:Ca2+-binding RTX toxin-like protein
VDSLVFEVIIGNPVPGTGINEFVNGQPAQEFITVLPVSVVNSITVLPGAGNDKVSLVFDGGDVIPSGGIAILDTAGDHDSLEVLGSQFDDDQFVLDYDSTASRDTIRHHVADTARVAYTGMENVSVQGRGGADTIDVEAASGYPALVLDGGKGANQFFLGDSAADLDRITTVAPLLIQGGPDHDTLTLKDDQTAAGGHVYSLPFLQPTGSDFTRDSSLAIHYSLVEEFELNSSNFDDTVYVMGVIVDSTTRINTGLGNDMIRVDSNGTDPLGTVDTVQGPLYIDAGADLAVDQLILNDEGDTTADVVNITATSITNDIFNPLQSFFHSFSTGLVYSGLSDLIIAMGGPPVGHEPTGNVINVQGTAVDTTTTIFAGRANDQINVSGPDLAADLPPGADRLPGGTVDAIQGPLIVHGETGVNLLSVDDSLETDDTTVTLTATQVGLPGDNLFGPGGQLTYDSVASLTLRTGSGSDVVDVVSTHLDTATKVLTGDGNDTVNAGDGSSTLSQIQGGLTVNGQGQFPDGRDLLNLQDSGTSASQDYAIGAASVQRAGVAISYAGLESLLLHAGAFQDKVSVTATPPHMQLVIDSGKGADTFNVGNPSHLLDDIHGPVTMNGGADADYLLVDDQGTTSGKSYTLKLTAGLSSVSRATVGEISYVQVDNVVIETGDHDDMFTVVGNVTPEMPAVALKAGGGSDRLKGPDAASVWNLLGSNAGKLNGRLSFFSVENLEGGKHSDSFVFANGANIAGFLDGGDGSDTLDYSAYTSTVTVDLAAGTASGVATLKLGSVENVTGGGGNDRLLGDANDNVLSGGGGDDVLVGGDGQDILYGDVGRDLLIGGKGKDKLYGGADEDILIGGTTSHDSDLTALDALMAEWGRTDAVDYKHRIAHLRHGGSGSNNGGYLLNALTVQDDGSADGLFGEGDRDWFWAMLTGPNKDKLDADSSEIVN